MRRGLFIGLLLSALSLVSCGGDTDPLTESDYRAAGNEICQEWFEKLSDLSKAAENGSQEEIFEFTVAAGSLADDYTGRLLNLTPPASLADDRAEVQARLDEFDALVASTPETEDDFGEITDAGNAISDSLGNIWSSCRGG